MATQLTNYQCPACTGPLHFDGASGKLVCDFCGSSYDTAEIEALYAQKEAAAETAAQNKEAPPPDSVWSENETAGLRSYSCPSCGAELICDETTAATSCPCCGNPTVIAGPTPSRTTAVPAGRVPTATVLAAARAENSKNTNFYNSGGFRKESRRWAFIEIFRYGGEKCSAV